VYCPLVFARRGLAMHSFDRYREAGINLAMGTDTFPRDIIHEMRVGALVGKLVEGNFLAGNARDLYTAATLGGARLLGRDDLGRLAPGAQADIIVVDFDDLHVGPVNDPIRTLIHAASGAHVERVIVAGRTVVEDRRTVGVNESALLGRVRGINTALRAGIGARDWQERPVDDLLPPTFPTAR
jgi:cytosine/adenosine deaminase-related metal-dependent hydrolase